MSRPSTASGVNLRANPRPDVRSDCWPRCRRSTRGSRCVRVRDELNPSVV